MFLVFAGDKYYPCGGANDYLEKFDTLKEAITWITDRYIFYDGEEVEIKRKHIDGEYNFMCDWIHIYDLEKEDIVWTEDTPDAISKFLFCSVRIPLSRNNFFSTK